MKAVILAAGRGSRMMPLTEDEPKALLELNEKTILGRQIEILKENDIPEEDIVIVTGYLSEKIEDFLKESRVQTVENTEWSNTDNLYSFLLTENICAGEDLLILNGDAVFNPEIVKRTLSNNNSCYPIDTQSEDDESLKVSIENEELKGILDKGAVNHDGTTTEIFFISQEHNRELYQKGRKIAKEDKTQWFDNAVDELVPVENFEIIDVSDLAWTELDTPEDLEKLREDLKNDNMDYGHV